MNKTTSSSKSLRYCIVQLILIAGLIPNLTKAATLYSIANGNWSSTSSWSLSSGGATCGCTPAVSDFINVTHRITLDVNLTGGTGITGTLKINPGGWLDGANSFSLEILSAGKLDMCGKLTVRNLTFNNNSIVTECAGARIEVNGNFQNKNNSSNITLHGTMVVSGSFTNGNGAVISGTGGITVLAGPISNTGNTFGCNGITPCSPLPCSVISPCFALPVELIYFSSQTNSKNVTLDWSTASEINNSGFAVERSADGEHFESIGWIQGNGNTTVIQHYAFADFSLSPGTRYYRLKQTDYDGRFTYSNVLVVHIRMPKQFTIYPNLLSAENPGIFVICPEHETGKIEIFSSSGQLIYFQNFVSTAQDANEFPFISLPGIANGIYSVCYTSESDRKSIKLIVAR